MADSESSSWSGSESDGQMGMGMKAAIVMMRTKFSEVKDITTETLSGWLQLEEPKENIVLMDCRDQEEYAISHIQGARRVDWHKVHPHYLITDLPKDKPSILVCYCSIGYRSSTLADKIQKYMATPARGKDKWPEIKVYNLEGSLFQWANEGRAMVDASGQPTKFCHPYNAVWGKMLHKDLRFTTPS